MRQWILLLLLSVSSFSATIEKPFMTKEMLDNDLETHEYQLFYTKTLDIPTEGLEAKIVFDGSLRGYFNFLESERKLQFKITNETIGSSIEGALRGAQQTVKQALNNPNILNNAVYGMGIGLITNPLSTLVFGDDTYAQVTDYYDKKTPKTRVIKFIQSDESLPEDERKMIYDASNRSYHFNRGKACSLLIPKKYEKVATNCNQEQN